MKGEILCLLLIWQGTSVLVLGAKSDAMLLTDVNVLTLSEGKMTNARRSSPIPQLKCVGGSAGCSAFRPKTVQCYNRGTDGYDVQWECKADMDNSYRFGQVQVSCEGYDHPDDPYILRGSCGLEYTIDLTEEGNQKKQSGGYHGNNHDSYHDRSQYSYKNKTTSVLQDLVYLGIVAGIIYIIYKSCIAAPAQSNAQGYPHGPPPSAPPPSYEDTFNNQQAPPSYGFRQDYMPNTGGSCSGGAAGAGSYTQAGQQGATGGFWSGAATGGLLGYLFGRSGTNTHYQQRPRSWWGNGWGTGWGNGWGTGWGNNRGTGWGSGWGTGGGSTWGQSSRSSWSRPASSSSGTSSGTRTASGFGGTTRR